jgi:hypothetical protein
MTANITRDAIVNPVPAAELAIEPPRPATAAQRQRAYRMRCKRAVIQAIGEEAAASRVTLLTLLNSDLAQLDGNPREVMRPALLNSARRVIRMLVTRYGIDLAE